MVEGTKVKCTKEVETIVGVCEDNCVLTELHHNSILALSCTASSDVGSESVGFGNQNGLRRCSSKNF